jgi:hypothetical protein
LCNLRKHIIGDLERTIRYVFMWKIARVIIIYVRLACVEYVLVTFFSRKRKKLCVFAFRCIDRKERVFFTYIQTQKSQHRAEQLNPLDLNRGGDQSTDADRSRGCPRVSLVTDRVGETGRVRGYNDKDNHIAKLPNPPCREHDQRRSPLA